MLKQAATQALAAPIIWNRLRARAAPAGSVTILCYHTLGDVEGWTARGISDFQADLALLSDRFEIVPLETGLERLGDTSAPPSVVLTFDDGDRGLARDLLPSLEDARATATIYVATGQIETGQPFWFDRVVNALQQPCSIDVEGLGHWRLGEETGKARWALIGDILAAIKTMPEDAREAAADTVVRQAGATTDTHPLGPMRVEDLQRLAEHPAITIGAHSHGHELLDGIAPEAARESVRRSLTLLREWTGQSVVHFAYPNGNYSPDLATMLQDEGCASATILEERPALPSDDRFMLPRVSVGRYDTPDRMIVRMAGI